jgi:hypothetical protein
MLMAAPMAGCGNYLYNLVPVLQFSCTVEPGARTSFLGAADRFASERGFGAKQQVFRSCPSAPNLYLQFERLDAMFTVQTRIVSREPDAEYPDTMVPCFSQTDFSVWFYRSRLGGEDVLKPLAREFAETVASTPGVSGFHETFDREW